MLPLFSSTITNSNKLNILSLKYLISTTYIDIVKVIRKSEFGAKTQFNANVNMLLRSLDSMLVKRFNKDDI